MYNLNDTNLRNLVPRALFPGKSALGTRLQSADRPQTLVYNHSLFFGQCYRKIHLLIPALGFASFLMKRPEKKCIFSRKTTKQRCSFIKHITKAFLNVYPSSPYTLLH